MSFSSQKTIYFWYDEYKLLLFHSFSTLKDFSSSSAWLIHMKCSLTSENDIPIYPSGFKTTFSYCYWLLLFFNTGSSGGIKREAKHFPVAQQCAVTDCRGSSDLFIIGTCFVTNKNRLLLKEMGNSYQHDDLCNLSHFLVAYKSFFLKFSLYFGFLFAFPKYSVQSSGLF